MDYPCPRAATQDNIGLSLSKGGYQLRMKHPISTQIVIDAHSPTIGYFSTPPYLVDEDSYFTVELWATMFTSIYISIVVDNVPIESLYQPVWASPEGNTRWIRTLLLKKGQVIYIFTGGDGQPHHGRIFLRKIASEYAPANAGY